MIDLVSDIIGAFVAVGERNIEARERRQTKQQQNWERAIRRWEGPALDPLFQVVLRVPMDDGYEALLIRDMTWLALAGAFPEHYARTWKGDVPTEWGRVPYNGAIALANQYMPEVFNRNYAENAWQWWIVPKGDTPATSPGWKYNGEAWEFSQKVGTEVKDINEIKDVLGV